MPVMCLQGNGRQAKSKFPLPRPYIGFQEDVTKIKGVSSHIKIWIKDVVKFTTKNSHHMYLPQNLPQSRGPL
ncbi:hypothetical protein STEG23_011627, partial [Scotinomys teguina]